MTTHHQAARDLLTLSALRLFLPSPVFSELADDESRKILLRAANRIGKTRHLAWLVARDAIHIEDFPQRLVGPTNKHVHTILGGYLAEFLEGHLDPRSYYDAGRGWNGGRCKEIITANGNVIELRSGEDKPEAHEGARMARIAIDEPPSRAHYSANRSRLVDLNGQMVIAATMVNRPVEYLRKMVEGDESTPGPGRTHHESTGWTQYVAEFNAANCPWYSPQVIAQWLQDAQMSEWDFNQRIKGGWEGTEVDRIYRQFTEANVSTDTPIDVDVGVALWMDHGELAGHQVGLLALYAGNRVWVIDEVCNDDPTEPDEDAGDYLEMMRGHGIHPSDVDKAIGDVNTAGKAKAGRSVNELIEAAMARRIGAKRPPFRIRTASKKPGSKDWGHRVVNRASRRVDITIHPRCKGLLKTMRYWKGTTKPNTEDGKLAHAADALRYGLVDLLGVRGDYARLHFDW